jgi:hypothetical protein
VKLNGKLYHQAALKRAKELDPSLGEHL